MAKEKTYYAMMKKVSVSVPVLDENGKVVPVRDASGNPKMSQGRLVEMKRTIVFNNVSANPKIGFLSTYTTSDPVEIKELDAKVADEGSPIMTEAMYKQRKNPEQWATEQQYLEREKVLVESIDSRDAEIERLKKELSSKGK